MMILSTWTGACQLRVRNVLRSHNNICVESSSPFYRSKGDSSYQNFGRGDESAAAAINPFELFLSSPVC